MAGSTSKKRTHQEFSSKPKVQKPSKKQKKKNLLAYNSDSDNEDDTSANFKPVNLEDSDDDIENAVVDDGAFSDSASDAESGSGSENEASSARQKLTKRKSTTSKALTKVAQDAPLLDDDQLDEVDEDDEADLEADSFDLEDLDDETGLSTMQKSKSKRNDPTAFATSLSKILSTKLSTTRRSDPLLSRSAEAHKAAKDVVDAALEAKARKQMRQQKLAALEKGRVRDVLVATTNELTGDLEESTAEILETEKRLRKVAQRGVVKLFNAVRMSQVRGQEAETQSRKDGFVGIKSREEKVSEMSRKGFLDLIASGGGGAKRGGSEEA
jgi:hypothetical protein